MPVRGRGAPLERLPADFVAAVKGRRFHDAATNEELTDRWSGGGDRLARALLALAAAHHRASTGDVGGAGVEAGRAVRALEELPLDPFAAVLIEHSRQLLRALHEGRDPPPMPLGFR